MALGQWAVQDKIWKLNVVPPTDAKDEWERELKKYTGWTPEDFYKSIRDRRTYMTGQAVKGVVGGRKREREEAAM